MCLFTERFAAELNSLSKERMYEVIKGFWPTADLVFESFDEQSYASFLKYLENELSHLRNHQQHFAVQNLEGTFNVIHRLQKNLSKAQAEALRALSGGFLNAEPATIQRSIELSVRLWLTLNINSSAIAVGPTFPDETPLDWDHDMSLEALAQRQFTKCWAR